MSVLDETEGEIVPCWARPDSYPRPLAFPGLMSDEQGNSIVTSLNKSEEQNRELSWNLVLVGKQVSLETYLDPVE